MNFISRVVLSVSLLGTVAFLSGCASPKPDPSIFPTVGDGGTNQVATEVARLQVGDQVTVTLSGPPDETVPPHVETVSEQGTISMPYVGTVQAKGKTAGELEQEIQDLYVPKYYTHLNVTVITGDRVYYVNGEVKSPGRQLYVGMTTVTRAITSAGDFSDFGNHRNVWLIRGNHRLKVDCDKIFEHPERDPLVYPGDQIVVRRRLY